MSVFGSAEGFEEPLVTVEEKQLKFEELFTGVLSEFGTMMDELGLSCDGVPRRVKPGHTVFAFTNEALHKLEKNFIKKKRGSKKLTPEEVRILISSHISPDTLSYASITLTSPERQLDTLVGSPVSLSCERGKAVVRDTRGSGAHILSVLVPDKDEGGNGRCVYVIDECLVHTAANLVSPPQV
jgi:hypothetical protein